MKIGINGLGRIGRLALRVALGGVTRNAADRNKSTRLEVVHLNDPNGCTETIAHLLEFDSIHGKWDAGMTVWGSTPTCRGFDHFNGFYSAASDYFTHNVGAGYDYHFDFGTDWSASGVYTTHHVTTAVQAWVRKQIEHSLHAKTFAYVAHEAVHGPLEVPLSYIEGPCEQLVPADHPSRRIYCGMVRAAVESLRNISESYKSLGIWDETLVILSADNVSSPQGKIC